MNVEKAKRPGPVNDRGRFEGIATLSDYRAHSVAEGSCGCNAIDLLVLSS